MINRKIQIIPSRELKDWKLSKLAGKEGVIVSNIYKIKNVGCWVKVKNENEEEIEWYIPISSIQLTSH